MKSSSALIPAICAAATAALAFWWNKRGIHSSRAAHDDPEPSPLIASPNEVTDEDSPHDPVLQPPSSFQSALCEEAQGSTDPATPAVHVADMDAVHRASGRDAGEDVGARVAQLELTVAQLRDELDSAVRSIDSLCGAVRASQGHLTTRMAEILVALDELGDQSDGSVRSSDLSVEDLEALSSRSL